MSQYGESFPQSPGGPPGPPAASGPPPSVRTAVNLIWVGVALSVLSAILGIVFIDDAIDQAMQNDTSGLSEDAVRTASIVGVVAFLVISVGIAVLFAIFLRKGANWARIVYTVLTVISILFSLIGIGGQPAVVMISTLVGIVLSVAVLFFLFRPDSNAYFSAPKSRFADGR